jgi:ribosomal protein S27E
MEERDLLLDGNAAGGLLGEVFALEITTARSTCAACGAVGEIGALTVYAHAPGTVVRCPACGAVLLRVVRGPGRIWLDVRGVACLELRAES